MEVVVTNADAEPESVGRISQTDLISIHRQFTAARPTVDAFRRGHIDHLLLALTRLIEQDGPTTEYQQWISSALSN